MGEKPDLLNPQGLGQPPLEEPAPFRRPNAITRDTAKQVEELKEKSFKAHDGAVWSLAFGTSGAEFVSGGADYKARVWDADTGKKRLDDLEGHFEAVKAVAMSPDNQLIATASAKGHIKFWNRSGGTVVRDVIHESAAPRGKRPNREKTEPKPINDIAFSPNGDYLASASADHSIKIWDAQTGQPDSDLPDGTGHKTSVQGVAWITDTALLSCGMDNQLCRWEPPLAAPAIGNRLGFAVRKGNGNVIHITGQGGPVLCVAVGHQTITVGGQSKKRMAYGTQLGGIGYWDGQFPGNQETWRRLREHNDDIRAIAFSVDDSLLVSASWDQTIKLWDTESYKVVHTLVIEKDDPKVYCMTFSPDGHWIITGHSDGTIRFWGLPEKATNAAAQ